MSRSIPFWLLTSVLLTTAPPAHAQTATKISRLGYLTGAGAAPSPALVKALRDLNYAEGQNMTIDFRTADGDPKKRAELAVELVRLSE